jgi:zinc finger protein-like protein
LNAALGQAAEQRAGIVQQLVCKSEEIHTTLRKHLAKEEEQLFPLLLRHFSHAEQVCI